MPPWQKPENALRRANELLEVGKKQDALDTLHDVIKARKYRQWTKVHEQIMNKHLELCVELRKPHLAKDGLFQYRNMCQQVNSKSLEDVIGTFLEMAEKKTEQAREESHGLVEDVEDLDQAESPEKLLLSAVSGEGAQDRADRAVLSPWLRFLWESYRQCLELLRNNMQVELLYHKVAKQAFQFCLKYQRKAEFRKLCDNLRTHLNQIQKTQHTHSHYALKLTNLETLALHQETRLIQLDIAIQMELWQEAFKSVEDVHQLMQLSKRQAKPSTLASYYEKLALIFWKADNTLYHAAALMKLFQLTREMKKSVSADELAHLATRVLLSTLSVNFSATLSDLGRHLEMEETQMENRRRLATLIMLPSPPTRQGLLKDVVRLNVHTLALPVGQKFYKLLELDFCPLSLAQELQKQLQALDEIGKKDYTKYVDTLKEVAAYKILKQVSQVYQSATFKFLCKIIPYFDRTAVERLVVTAGKKSQMQVRLHHRTESVEFGGNEAASLGGQEDETNSALASVQLNVPVVQTMPNEQIKQHLQQMYSALQEASQAVDTESTKILMEQLRDQITIYGYHKADQHRAILERKKQIEAYKEMAEKIRSDQEEKQKEQERRLNEQKQREIEQRLQQEKSERQEQQKRRQQEELHRRMMQERLDRMKDLKLRKIIEELPEDELQNLDHELILQKQINHLEQEKREQLARLKQQEKKWDYFVRAMHLEEIPLREDEYKEWAVKDREKWENYETERIKKAVEDHKNMIDAYNRFKRMEDDADDVVEKIRVNRASDFQKRLEDWEKRLKETREKRLQERKDERKAKRREEWLQSIKAQPPPAAETTANRPRIPLGGGSEREQRDDRYGPRPPRPDEPSNWRTKDGVQPPMQDRDRDRGGDRDRGDRDRGDRGEREPPSETPENWRAAGRAQPDWGARVGLPTSGGPPERGAGGYRRGYEDRRGPAGYEEGRRGPPSNGPGYDEGRRPLPSGPAYEEDRPAPPPTGYEGRRSYGERRDRERPDRDDYEDRRGPPPSDERRTKDGVQPPMQDRDRDRVEREPPSETPENWRAAGRPQSDWSARVGPPAAGGPPERGGSGYRRGYEDRRGPGGYEEGRRGPPSSGPGYDEGRRGPPPSYEEDRRGPPSAGYEGRRSYDDRRDRERPDRDDYEDRRGPPPGDRDRGDRDRGEREPPSEAPESWRAAGRAQPDWSARVGPPASGGPPERGGGGRPPTSGYDRDDRERYGGSGSYTKAWDRDRRDQGPPPPSRLDQPESQGSWRRGGPPPPTVDRERDRDLPPPAPRQESESSWRRGPPQPPPADRDRDAPPPRSEGGGAWRRDGPPPGQQPPPTERDFPPSRSETGGGGGAWRRGGPQQPPPERESSDGQGAWRRAGPPPGDRDRDRDREREPPRQETGGAWRRGPPQSDDRDRRFART